VVGEGQISVPDRASPAAFVGLTISVKWPQIRCSGGNFAVPGLVFLHPIRFHCTPLASPLIP